MDENIFTAKRAEEVKNEDSKNSTQIKDSLHGKPPDSKHSLDAKPPSQKRPRITEILVANDSDKETYYFNQIRYTRHIPSTPHGKIEEFGIIQDVYGDGKCGIYSTMEGLTHMGVPHSLDMNTFRQDIYDYITNTILNPHEFEIWIREYP